MAASELAAWKLLTQRVNHWKSLSLRSNSYSASEQLAGSYVSRRQLLSEHTTEGVYKFVVDSEQKIWLSPVTESLPHSALVPKGAKVHGAGYAWVKNGRANVNGTSGHYMAEMPFIGEQIPLYDNAIRQTFRQHGIEVLEHHPSVGKLITEPQLK